EVGCDYGVDSKAEEDRCGVCLGDGSSCETVKDSYTEKDGYGYVDMLVIPKGARDIFIQEVQEAGNFLAVRAADSEEYFLNGNYIIQWNGEYKVGGTIFFYERQGNLENLTSPGPTTQPVMVQLLFQEPNPGVRFKFTVKKSRPPSNELLEPEYSWKYGAWTDCSASCGLGEQQQPVRCFEEDVGVVEEGLCDPNTRPDDRHRRCKNMECPARWWVGGWQPCSSSCGSDGVRKRVVLCVRTVGGEERVLKPGDCKHLPKPKPVVPCNRDITCGSAWAMGNWSECSLSCGGGVKSRTVRCLTEPRVSCDPVSRPRSTTFCNLQSCSSSHKPRPQPENPTSNLPAQTTRTPAAPTSTPLPDVLHEDDQDFILVKNVSAEDHPHTTASPTVSEDEEGSADLQPPDKGSRYTPGYDYIVEEDGGEERESVFTIQPPTGAANTPTPLTTTTPLHTALTTAEPTRGLLTTATPASTKGPANAKAAGYHQTTPASRTPTRKTGKNSSSQSGSDRTPLPSPAVTNMKLKKTLTPRSPGKAKHQKTTAHSPGGAGRKTAAFWVVGNWSECSVSCGLGAVWRTVSCSSGLDADCSSKKKPDPAQHCNLRPCATWHMSNWSRCPEGCGGGTARRDVQCVDPQNGRALRPFHCQAQSPRPPRTLPCSTRPCLRWAHLPWGSCSRSCGEGVKERLVFCPEDGRCNDTLRPNGTAPCNLQPCVTWTADPWQECSVSCGGGVQKRVIRCMNEDSGEEERSGLCLKNNKPESVRKCSLDECGTNSDLPACKRNSMSGRFCDKLKLLGRCVLRSIRRQCCLTCRT
ncbi:hypothetical protein NFI96_024098, partial [Prochilodus magdalenae]